MAAPAVGTPVTFYPPCDHPRKEGRPDDMPFAAVVAHCNDDGTVNIGYLDCNGVACSEQNVPASALTAQKKKEEPKSESKSK